MKIASKMCIYTNDSFMVESLAAEEEKDTSIAVEDVNEKKVQTSEGREVWVATIHHG